MNCTLRLALAAVLDPYPRVVVDCYACFSRELSMKKIILVGLAILAVSTSAALAKSHAKKPKAEAAATQVRSWARLVPLTARCM